MAYLPADRRRRSGGLFRVLSALPARHQVAAGRAPSQPSTTIDPKALAINARTKEISHRQGVEADTRKAGLPPAGTGFIVRVRASAGWRSASLVGDPSGALAGATNAIRGRA
jgi:hypothetical protein